MRSDQGAQVTLDRFFALCEEADNGNCAVAPDSGLVRQGFARDDLFVCVHEQFMTETAAMADVVLPATTFLEHDDIYIASGHTYLQIARKVVEPLGEARPNHFVICELARRGGAAHPGPPGRPQRWRGPADPPGNATNTITGGVRNPPHPP